MNVGLPARCAINARHVIIDQQQHFGSINLPACNDPCVPPAVGLFDGLHKKRRLPNVLQPAKQERWLGNSPAGNT